jgi:hypothetical protein
MNIAEERAWQRISELANVHPKAVDLARYVSLAVRVDPPLLRRLRLDTQLLPDSDASAEADLWFSDLSESRDGEGFVFDPQVAALLQQRLATERLADGRRALDVAYQHLETAHGDWPASLQVEERVTYLALSVGPAVDDEIAQTLRPALVAMAESEQRGLEIARWVLRAMPRMPARARESDAAVALLVAAITRIGAGADALAGTEGHGLPLDLGWLLRPSALGARKALSFEVRTDAVVFREPGHATAERLQIDVPDTRPVVIELSWQLAQGGGARLVAANLDVPVALPAGWRTLQLRTLTGEAYRLERTVPTGATAVRKTCFVIQGFGKKTDFTDGRVLDLDESYAVIKDAVEAAGLKCIRADEIMHSGTIDLPMYEQLLGADLVIADLSTYNLSAAFELGVRYGLRPHATMVVVEEGFKQVFDVTHIVIWRYKHLGEGIGRRESARFTAELKAAIAVKMVDNSVDSPVYTFLPRLVPPRIGAPASPTLASISARPRGVRRCLVVQGFGRKTDYRDGRVLDLDASYAIIKDAVEAAGLECIRADEIEHSGTIDLPLYEQLLGADLVIVDLSTYNVNAVFELGVRYALRPHATIVVAEEQFQHPFDVSHIAIMRYKHLGDDIGRREAARFTAQLKAEVAVKMADDTTDSPIYMLMPDLQPPRMPLVDSDTTTP